MGTYVPQEGRTTRISKSRLAENYGARVSCAQGESGGIDNKYLQKFPEFLEFKNRKPERREEAALIETEGLDPEEAIENSYLALRGEIENDLLIRAKAGSPEFFEQLVIDLLLKMGYGGSRKEAGRAIGKSGDEGIDGVIDEDALGLDVVYVQAKRWSNRSVNRQDIQQFVGALQGKRARKGIFITTSDFANSAREYIKTIDNKVVLIDGVQVAARAVVAAVDDRIGHVAELGLDVEGQRQAALAG